MDMIGRRRLAVAGGVLAFAGLGVFAWRRATGSMAAYDGYAAAIREKPDAGLVALLRTATLAPNGHNTQPWRARLDGDAILLMPDPSRRTPVVDPDDHHLFVSLGCAAETLAIAAAATGRSCTIGVAPDGSAIRCALGGATGAARPDPLFDAIFRRQSTRAEYDGRPVPARDLAALERAGRAEGVGLTVLTEPAAMARLRALAVAANTAQLADAAFLAELKRWIRFNPRAAMRHGDGLFAACTGAPVLPDWLGPHAFDLAFTAKAENDRLARQIASSSGVAVFAGARADPAHWIAVGRACQRFALTATSLGLKLAFINQPVEVADFRQDLARLIGAPDRRPDIVLRFGYGPTLPYAPRRPVGAVLV